MENMIGDIPWPLGHGSEEFRLISLDNRYVGFGGTVPQFDSICPYWFEYRFINEYLVS